MPIFSKLSQKQILAIFGGLFALLLISIFVAFQLTNSQRSQAKETQNNSNQNSSAFSVFSNNSENSQNSTSSNSQKSEQNSSTNSSQNSDNSSQEVANSIVNSPNSANSETKTTDFNSVFVGKIGNNDIEMNLDYELIKSLYSKKVLPKNPQSVGSYFYKSQNKSIEIRGDYFQKNGNILLEEFVDNKKTGHFEFDTNFNSIEKGFKGTWTNSKTGEKLDFEVINEKNSTKKLEDQPIKLSQTCQENEDQWLKNGNGAVASGITYDPINLGNGEKIVSKICGGIGAYQGIYNFNYVAANGQKKLLNLPYFDRTSKSLKNQTDKCVRGFDWRDGNLTINCSGRGLNDCGSEDIYKWNSISKELELITAKYQDECILDKPENQNKTDEEKVELMKNLEFPVIYQK